MDLWTTCDPVWVKIASQPETRFKVRPLDAAERTKLLNAFNVEGVTENIAKADPDAVFAALKVALVDWDGVFDRKTRQPVPFRPESVRFLMPVDAAALAWEVLGVSLLGAEEVGNSDSQSTSGSD